MSQNFPRNKSAPPGSVSRVLFFFNEQYVSVTKSRNIQLIYFQMEEDETLDKEFDKIFHDEKVNLSTLNPSAGEVDEERKKYYRYKTAVIFRSIQ